MGGLWLVVSSMAMARDNPHLWVRSFGAIAVRPSGVMVDSAVEARAPIFRFGGVMNNMTFIGAGVRIAVTPVHIDLAARATIQPLDILPVTVEAFYGNYWESPWGMIGTDRVAGNLGPDRRPTYEADEDYAARTLGFSIQPTFQAKVGKIAGFTSLNFTWMRADPGPEPLPYYFEPFRGMVLTQTDRVFEHTSAVVYDAYSGEGTPIFRVGPALRGRAAKNTDDLTIQVGALAQWRPGKKNHDPNLALIAVPYLIDPDFKGWAPQVALVVTVTQIVPFKKVL